MYMGILTITIRNIILCFWVPLPPQTANSLKYGLRLDLSLTSI